MLRLEDEKESLFREIYKDKVNPIRGFMDFFQELKSSGFLTGVATSAPLANLELIGGSLGILGHMESVLASEHVAKHKPDPEVYLKSAENLQVEPDACIVVLSSHNKHELPLCEAYIQDFSEINLEKLHGLSMV